MTRLVDTSLVSELELSGECINLILAAGFEERVFVSLERLNSLNLEINCILIIRYRDGQDQNNENFNKLKTLAKDLFPESVIEVTHNDELRFDSLVSSESALNQHFLFDISVANTSLIFEVLTLLHQGRARFSIIYTEAESYHPTQEEYEKYLGQDEISSFEKMAEFELSDIMFSSNSSMTELNGFSGTMYSTYHWMLIAFLAFKRTRLARIVNNFEFDRKVFIPTEPTRLDLKWRKDAQIQINTDLFSDGELLDPLSSLDWISTYKKLRDLYFEYRVRSNYNFVLAPLGSKMQKVSSWLFAVHFTRVKVVTSNPSQVYPDKYSHGFKDTFFVALSEEIETMEDQDL